MNGSCRRFFGPRTRIVRVARVVRVARLFGSRDSRAVSPLKFVELGPYRAHSCPAQSPSRPESFTIASIARPSRRARMQHTAAQRPHGDSILDRRAMGAWCWSGAARAVPDGERQRRILSSAWALEDFGSDHAADEAEPEHAKHQRGHALYFARIDHSAQAIAQEDGQRGHAAQRRGGCGENRHG